MDKEFDELLTKDAHKQATSDKLDLVRNQIRYMRDLDKEIEDAEQRLSQLKFERRDLEFNTLPALFMQNKITRIDLDEEGNLPAYEAKLKDYYHANIKAEWPDEKRETAFAWLEKQRLGDLIKTVFTVEIGRGNEKLTKKVQAALRAIKGLTFKKEQSVPWNTLTAAIKEFYRDGIVLKDEELEKLGATVSKCVTLQRKKEK